MPLSPVLTPCETQDGTDTHAQITSGDGAHAANRSYFASISDARSKSTSARCRGQRRSDRGKGRAWPRSWLGSRARWLSSVWLEPRAQGRLARPWVPARPLEEGLVLSRGVVFSIAQPEIQISLVRPRQTRLRSIKPSAAICCKLCLMLVGDHMRCSPPALLGRADQVIE